LERGHRANADSAESTDRSAVFVNQKMEFNPNNNIVKLCLQGMDMEAKGNHEEAGEIFLQAWNEATNDFEKYLAAYYLARQQTENY
jgi:hypothetical protein